MRVVQVSGKGGEGVRSHDSSTGWLLLGFLFLFEAVANGGVYLANQEGFGYELAQNLGIPSEQWAGASHLVATIAALFPVLFFMFARENSRNRIISEHEI